MHTSLIEEMCTTALLHGTFTLRSGNTSDVYFDKYKFESNPKLLSRITRAMIPLIPPNTDVLAGLEMGGIPIATLLSHQTNIPTAFIRKEPKQYGTCKYAEGTDLEHKRIILIEDVVSSGGAIIDAVHKLREDNIDVHTALCVLDRETGGSEALAKEGVTLISLFTASEMQR